MSSGFDFVNAKRGSIVESKLSWLKLAYFLGDLKQTDVLVSFRRCNRFTSFVRIAIKPNSQLYLSK